MNSQPECSVLYIRINQQKIFYLKFILEGYDGLAVLTTEDNTTGLVSLHFPETSRKDLFILLQNIAEKLKT
jgi:hypothetical protein